MNKTYPKLVFELPTIEAETDTLFDFCYREDLTGWDWSEMVYEQHPKLKEMLVGVKDKVEFYNQIRNYVESYDKENKADIEQVREVFQQAWDEVEGKYYTSLVKDFEIDFPEDVKVIRAAISINPICPRYLDKWSFNVFYKFSKESALSVSIHETIHFLYFQKWSEIFSGYDKDKFETPHSEWKLSEILVNPIINNNPVIQEILKGYKSPGYGEFRNIVIEGKYLNKYFGEIYQEHLKGRMSFGDFLKKSWSEYDKYKDIIEGQSK